MIGTTPTIVGQFASRLNAFSPLGRAIRLPLRMLPRNAVVPVLSGPNRGLKWVVGSSVHGCWLGHYEAGVARRIAALIEPGMTVFDVGAHVGFYTLLLSRAVGPRGRVFAFEPGSANLLRLRRHLALNNVSNVEIVEAAVSNAPGRVLFSENESVGHISPSGTAVSAVRLDDFPRPDFIKMDIEGGEVDALDGARSVLSGGYVTMAIALHDTDAEVASRLRDRYRLDRIGDVLIARPA